MMLRFGLFMLMEFVAFFIATLNFRFCAKGHIARTVSTDMLMAFNGFFVIRLVADATSPWEIAGYVLGAGLGSVCAMYLTRRLEDKDHKA